MRLNCWVIGLLLTSALNYSVADDLTADDIERLNKESQLRLEEALKYLSWTEVDRLARLAKARTKSLSYYELQLLRNGINECEFFSGRLKSPQQ